ncbi:MAG: hypothetical protein CMP20_15860 [Rickettsiales bacterium]|nr:hypothetical protein [Rickettsiales bacterium]
MTDVVELLRKDIEFSETSDQLASGTFAYAHVYHPNDTLPRFVLYSDEYLMPGGNIIIPETDYRVHWAKIEQKVHSDDSDAEYATFCLNYRPRQDIWVVQLGYYGKYKKLARTVPIPSFKTLEEAFKGVSQIYADKRLFQQLLWLSNNHPNHPAPQPTHLLKFSDHVDNCSDVTFCTKFRWFYPTTAEVCMSANGVRSPTTKRRCNEKQTQTTKRSKTLEPETVQTITIKTNLYGTVRIDYAGDFIAFNTGPKHDDVVTPYVFDDFDYDVAQEHPRLFSRAFMHAKVSGQANMRFEEDVNAIVLSPAEGSVTVY